MSMGGVGNKEESSMSLAKVCLYISRSAVLLHHRYVPHALVRCSVERFSQTRSCYKTAAAFTNNDSSNKQKHC